MLKVQPSFYLIIMNAIKHIAVLYTGGTIGMKPTINGLTPAPNLEELTASVFAEFSNQLHCDWFSNHPLIDSSCISLGDWQQWLDWIDHKQKYYDGILILHGTDTLAYSANIIALARPQLHKPIIMTGALWPFSAHNSDAPLNLQTALAAFTLPLQQTAIAFNGHLWRAIGSTKVSTQCADGFHTPHFSPLGKWSATQGWQQLHFSEPPISAISLKPAIINPAVKIHCYTLTPGDNAEMIASSMKQNFADGIVLQSYGNGNTPNNTDLIQTIEQICRQGKPVLNISQVLQGQVSDTYAQGEALRNSGVINAGCCNLETAVALLTLAASNKWSESYIKEQLKQNQLL